MLGHNPAVLNRLQNLMNTLDASSTWLEGIISDPNRDPDFSVLKTMIKDALQILEQQSPTKPPQVYRGSINLAVEDNRDPNYLYDEQGRNLGPKEGRDR